MDLRNPTRLVTYRTPCGAKGLAEHSKSGEALHEQICPKEDCDSCKSRSVCSRETILNLFPSISIDNSREWQPVQELYRIIKEDEESSN
jgi:hypothetical protein